MAIDEYIQKVRDKIYRISAETLGVDTRLNYGISDIVSKPNIRNWAALLGVGATVVLAPVAIEAQETYQSEKSVINNPEHCASLRIFYNERLETMFSSMRDYVLNRGNPEAVKRAYKSFEEAYRDAAIIESVGNFISCDGNTDNKSPSTGSLPGHREMYERFWKHPELNRDGLTKKS